MDLQTLVLVNFGVHRRAEVQLADQELVFVEGQNLDYGGGSNGSGKSSLLSDAITWVLFGETTKGERGDEVVRRPEDHEGTMVLVEFRTPAHQLVRVERYRKDRRHKNALRLFVDGEEHTRSQAKLTQEYLDRLIGATRETWLYTTILGQGQSFRFSALRDAERGALLEEIQGLRVFDKARDRARDISRSLDRSMEQLSLKAEGLQEQIARDECALEEARSKVAEDQEALQAARQALQQQAAQLQEEIEARTQKTARKQAKREQAEAEIRRCSQALQEALSEQQDAAASVASARRQLQEARQQMTKLDDLGDCPTCEQTISEASREKVRKKHKARMQRIEGVCAVAVQAQEKATAHRQEQEDALHEAEDRVSGINHRLGNLSRAISTRKGRLRELRRQLDAPVQESSAEALIASLEASLEARVQESKELTAERRRIQESAAYPIWWVDGFQRLRANRMAEMVRFLNDRIRIYCDTLFGGGTTAYLTVEEKRTGAGVGTKVDLEVTTMGGTYKSASGGEKDRIDLAVAFALHDLAQGASGFSCNLLVADEIGQAVDPEGILKLAELLRLKLQTVSSVFVTSQNPVWRSAIDKVWTVRREAGASELIVRK